MKESTTISWIFLAIALASQEKAASTKEISKIADGINHAIPTEKEIGVSISWLIKNDFIIKKESKYKLSKNGFINYHFASLKTTILVEIWRNLERQIKLKT